MLVSTYTTSIALQILLSWFSSISRILKVLIWPKMPLSRTVLLSSNGLRSSQKETCSYADIVKNTCVPLQEALNMGETGGAFTQT
jgi:hypothetical protein